MAQVTLKKDWFGPNGQLYLARNNPNSIPDRFVDQLPSSVVVGEEPAVEVEVDGDEPKKSAPPVKK